MPRVPRPCACGCGRLTTATRSPQCQRSYDAQRWTAKAQRYDGDWRRFSREAIATHIAKHGPVCPGWRRPAHAVDAREFVTDHDVGPLCSPCNGRKAATHDKQRAGR